MIALFVVIGIAACARHTTPEVASLPAYPNPGFGRVGCYAVADASGPPSRSGESVQTASARIWLVLDSVSRAEYQRVIPERAPALQELRRATLLQMRDTLVWIGGFWERGAPDSVIVHEASTFPGTVWRFASTPGGLSGRATTMSDLRTRTADGRDSGAIMIRSAQAARVSCAAVPQYPPGWPRVR